VLKRSPHPDVLISSLELIDPDDVDTARRGPALGDLHVEVEPPWV